VALADTAELAVRINLTGNASAGISKLQRQVSGLGKSIGRTGKGVGQIGAGLAKAGLAVGGGAIAGIVAAGKAATDFEDAFAGVKKTVDETKLKEAGLSFEGLAKSFREMATDIPISAVDFAKIGETAGALGVRAEDITRFTKVVAELGVTTNLTSDQAADALGRVGTILGLKGKQIDEFADALVGLGNAGASTESEIIDITKRFASQGKAAGLTKEEILGLASATSSLGFEPELGGSALSRVFGEMATNIAVANKKGKVFSKAVGIPIATLQKQLDKGKGLPLFIDLLQELQGMSTTEASRFLKGLGVNRQSDIRLLRSMADQLPFVNEQLEIAKKSQGALLKEAEKKFATTASKIQLLKNNIIEAGIAVGSEFLPSVRRAIDKIIGVLKQPGTKGDLVQLGKDIAKAIDGIDFDQLLADVKKFAGFLKGVAGTAKTMFDWFNKLPGPIKEATVLLAALTQLPGGSLITSGVGNVAGGIAETVIRGLGSRLPGGAGKLFAQPVFVTNWPPGMGLGGGIPGKGGGGGLVGNALKGLGLLLAVQLAEEWGPKLNGLGADLGKGWRDWLNSQTGIKVPTFDLGEISWPFGSKNTPTILPEVFGHNGLLGGTPKAPGKIPQNNPNPDRGDRGQDPNAVAFGSKFTKTLDANAMAVGSKIQATTDKVAETTSSVDRMKSAIGTDVKATTAKVGTESAVTRTRIGSAAATNATVVSGAVTSSAGAIIAAIYAARPVVNVTQVTRNTTIQNRYGPSGGSSSVDHGGSIGFGGGD
jgi:TP901 family phage tail tape measure protein